MSLHAAHVIALLQFHTQRDLSVYADLPSSRSFTGFSDVGCW